MRSVHFEGTSRSMTCLSASFMTTYLVTSKGSAGGLTDLTLLVDTGTSTTPMDSHLADQLQLTGTADKLTAFDRDV